MDHFQRQKDGALFCEDVALSTIADNFGTPTYVYSKATIERHVRVLKEGLATIAHHICYAIKANGNLAVLDILKAAGCGFDAVSGGELARALHIGADPKSIIVSGVGKTNEEIRAALKADVLYICVESEEELLAIGDIAKSMGKLAPVALRVNPDVDAQTHAYIATGMRQNKFGIPHEEALSLYRKALAHAHLEPLGLSCHIGSQITELSPFKDAALRIKSLAQTLLADGIPLRFIGMGGGLGVPYHGESPPDPSTYGAALAEILNPLGLTLVLEPGRVIVGNAGVLLTRIVRSKSHGEFGFSIVDAGMNDLMRPALYNAEHRLETVAAPKNTNSGGVHKVVGPVCESADTFLSREDLPTLSTGDLVVLRTAGAYGFAMASTYNGRPLVAEVLVDGDKVHLARARQPVEELWRHEARFFQES